MCEDYYENLGDIYEIGKQAQTWVAYAWVSFGCSNRTPQTGGLRNIIHLPSSRGWESKIEVWIDTILGECWVSFLTWKLSFHLAPWHFFFFGGGVVFLLLSQKTLISKDCISNTHIGYWASYVDHWVIQFIKTYRHMNMKTVLAVYTTFINTLHLTKNIPLEH